MHANIGCNFTVPVPGGLELVEAVLQSILVVRCIVVALCGVDKIIDLILEDSVVVVSRASTEVSLIFDSVLAPSQECMDP